jgi:tRNA threonylcarbamoyl adenosine modification protein (Sua5/YciO/YrdC/YwlC family)
VEALARGDLVVLPTDTVYGVGGRPDLPGVTDRIFEAKRRPRGLTLPVLVAGLEQAGAVAALDHRARALAEAFWPGGLTLVVPRSDLARGWNLGDETDTIGIRMPDHRVARAVLEAAGPLAVTSANRSGEPTPDSCAGVRAVLGETVTLYLCADPLPGVSSTVLDLTGDRPRILRAGAVSPDDVLAALGPAAG